MYIFVCVGGPGFHFHTRDPFEIFREFFGGDDPFSGMFGGSMFTDFGGVSPPVCRSIQVIHTGGGISRRFRGSRD